MSRQDEPVGIQLLILDAAIPTLADAFSVSSFWMILILGRLAYYLQDRHVVYQMKTLCMPNTLVNNF